MNGTCAEDIFLYGRLKHLIHNPGVTDLQVRIHEEEPLIPRLLEYPIEDITMLHKGRGVQINARL
jgi:hypothetical protein